MTDDLIIKARAAELIRAGIERARFRRLCAGVVAVAFLVGVLVGMSIPFDIRAVTDHHEHFEPAVRPAHEQPSAKQ